LVFEKESGDLQNVLRKRAQLQKWGVHLNVIPDVVDDAVPRQRLKDDEILETWRKMFIGQKEDQLSI